MDENENNTFSTVIEVRPDSRIRNEFVPAIDQPKWGYDTPLSRNKFLRYTIDNRKEFTELEFLGEYDRENADCTAARCSAKVRVDEETLKELMEQAIKEDVSLEEYMRALLYTSSKVEHEKRVTREQEEKEKEEKNRKVLIGSGSISYDLKQKLFERYPLEEYETFSSNGDGGLGRRLVLIAEEFFNLN